MSSGISESSGSNSGSGSAALGNRDFKIILDMKSGGPPMSIHLVAPTMQEKAAWISDISQCMDNVHFNDLLHGSLSDTSSVIMPQSIRNDPKLFKDDVDIRFSRTLNSCKLPQIRYATPERLLQRLTDLRFLSIDFLNTFLLTYRVFTEGVTVLEALKKVFYDAEPPDGQVPAESLVSFDGMSSDGQLHLEDRRRSSATPRRTSGASSVSGYGSEVSDCREARSHTYFESALASQSSGSKGHWRSGYRKMEEEQCLGLISEVPPIIKRSPTLQLPGASPGRQSPKSPRRVSIKQEDSEEDASHLTIPKVIAGSSSSETLTDMAANSAPSSPSNLSSVTLIGSTGSGSGGSGSGSERGPHDIGSYSRTVSEETDTPVATEYTSKDDVQFTYDDPSPLSPSPKASPSIKNFKSPREKRLDSENDTDDDNSSPSEPYLGQYTNQNNQENHRASIASAPAPSTRSGSISIGMCHYWSGRRSIQDSDMSSARQSCCFQYDTPQSKAGVVITSSRQSHRSIGPDQIWSSTSTAAAAFAIATSASSNPPDKAPVRCQDGNNRTGSCRDRNKRKEPVSTAATMRVLNVLRHWVSKHAQDFELNIQLKNLTVEFLEDIVGSPNLLPAEHKAASQLLRLISKEEPENSKIDLDKLLAPPSTQSKESIETLSALEIAEQMTYIDHKIFVSIASEEFLGQAWMKTDKATRAPHIIFMTKRFNEVSQLVVSEIVRRSNMSSRVAAIEKWTAVADICRVLHNYNGVLEICAAFTNSSVYRLKKTWEKVSKTTKQTIERLQGVVSSDGRFRNLRDALRRCDPPCIPYLGVYLTDLSFIEEGTPNFTEDGLLNFSKMRMIAHVIREIRHFQQTPYKIDLITKVTNYLLDTTLLVEEDDLYRMSLEIEPRTSRLSTTTLIGLPPTTSGTSPGVYKN